MSIVTSTVDDFHSQFSSSVVDLYKNGDFVDLELVAGQPAQSLFVHSQLLAVFSPWFRRLFNDHHVFDLQSISRPVLIIPDHDFDSLQHFVHFIYNGLLRQSNDTCSHVVQLLSMMGINSFSDKTSAAATTKYHIELMKDPLSTCTAMEISCESTAIKYKDEDEQGESHENCSHDSTYADVEEFSFEFERVQSPANESQTVVHRHTLMSSGRTKKLKVQAFSRAIVRDKPLTKTFSCVECEKSFVDKLTFKEHRRVYHPVEKAYKCQKCKYSSSCELKLQQHFEKLHTKPKVYKPRTRDFPCDKCSYVAFHRGALNVHLRLHTGEKPFVCHICPFSTCWKSDLSSHLRVHSGIKPFKCSHCSYASTDSGTLKRHIRIHTGERPYLCHLCNYSASMSTHLKQHMVTHTGLKPFACRMCTVSFAHKSTLNKHVNSAHTAANPSSSASAIKTETVARVTVVSN